jgi:Tol biopolymer transport system component
MATITARVDGVSCASRVRVTAAYPYDLLFDQYTDGMVELFRKDIRTPGDTATRVFPNRRWATDPTASPEGSRIAVVRNDATGARGIWIVNPDGTGIMEVTSGADDQPSWSPDGTRIAFQRWTAGSDADIWIVKLDGTGEVNLTADQGATSQGRPAWGPGSRIAYSHRTGGEAHVWTMAGDGSDKRPVTSGEVYDDEPDWSPDGNLLAFQRFGDIWLVNAGGGGERPLAALAFGQFMPAWSPDGTLVAFSSPDAGGVFQIFTVRATGGWVAQRTFDLPGIGGNGIPPRKENPSWLRAR